MAGYQFTNGKEMKTLMYLRFIKDGKTFTDRFWTPDKESWQFTIPWNNFLTEDENWKREDEIFFAYLEADGSWVNSVRTVVSDKFKGLVGFIKYFYGGRLIIEEQSNIRQNEDRSR